MSYLYDDLLTRAYEASDIIVRDVSFGGTDEFISLERIINAVSAKTHYRVQLSTCSFGDISEDVKNAGAMMSLKNHSDICTSKIIVNSDKDATFQRFSVVHQLGLLMTISEPIKFFSDKHYTVSTHINYEITSIKRKDCSTNSYLLHEQLANIFALRVLMPHYGFYSAINRLDSLEQVAILFGVTREAVVSRIMLVD